MLQMILLLNTMKIEIIKILDLKLVIMLKFLSFKRSLLKDILLIDQNKFLLLVKLIIQFHGHMLLMISMMKRLLAPSMRKNYRAQISKDLG